MTFRAKPVVKRAQQAGLGEPGPTELLPQPRLRPDRRPRRVLHPGHRRRAHLLQRPPRAGRQRRRPVDHQGRVRATATRSRPGGSTRPSAGSAPQVVAGPPDRGPGAAAAPVASTSSAQSARRRSRSSGSSTTKLQAKLAAAGRRHRRRPRTSTPGSLEEATTPESRHAVGDRGRAGDRPATSTEPTAAAERGRQDQGRGRAQATSRAARPGRTSPRPSRPMPRPRPQAGDLGWLQADDTPDRRGVPRRPSSPPRSNTPTAVIEGERRHLPDRPRDRDRRRDGRRRLPGRSSTNDGHRPRQVPRGRPRRRHPRRSSRTRSWPTPPKPGPQREVAEIYLGEATADLGDDAVKVRHILYSPKDDPAGAATRSPPTIPRGPPPKTEADARRTPSSRRIPTCSTRSPARRATRRSAQGPTGTGGKLPVLRQRRARSTRRSRRRSSRPGLKAGELLAPVKSAFGWHVVQVMYHPTDLDQMNALKTEADGGADFATLARDNSEAPTAGDRRRPRLGRQGPARRAADRRDLRGADRQDVGRS